MINESSRLKKLANIITENQEQDLDELARTAGTGGSYVLTEKGKESLKQAKKSMELPEGLRKSHIAILAFLYKNEKEGNRVQKIDFAKERGVPQPAVNPLFNFLETEGYIAKEGYTAKAPTSSTPKNPQPSLDSILGDIDIEDE